MTGVRLAAVLLLGLAAGAVRAEVTLQPIHFAPGKSSATIHGGIVRGDAAILRGGLIIRRDERRRLRIGGP